MLMKLTTGHHDLGFAVSRLVNDLDLGGFRDGLDQTASDFP